MFVTCEVLKYEDSKHTQSPAQDDGCVVLSSHSEHDMSLTIDVLLVFRVDVEKYEVRTHFEYLTGTLVGKGYKRMSFVHGEEYVQGQVNPHLQKLAVCP